MLDLAVGLGVVDEDNQRVFILFIHLRRDTGVSFSVKFMRVDLHRVGHPVEVGGPVHLLVLVLDEAPEGPQDLFDRDIDLVAALMFLAGGGGHL